MRCSCLFLLSLGALFFPDGARANDAAVLQLTNVAQLGRLTLADAFSNHSVGLQGDVWWANPATGKFVLCDASGAALLGIDMRGQPVRAGQRVRVTGNGAAARDGAAIRLGVLGPVVDNDGVHAMQEKSGAIWLRAGRHPLRLDWFNGIADYGLDVEYSGPDLPRRKIPDAAFFRDATNATARGLDCDCFEVAGNALPETDPTNFLKRGITKNFDLRFASRIEHVGLSFRGFIAVPRDGLYIFHARSDDGSRLFIDAPSLRVEVVGQARLPAPREILLGQVLDAGCEWAQVSGTVTFASEVGGEWRLELRSGTGRISVEVAGGQNLRAADLIGRRVRTTGVCLAAFTTDGQKIPGTLLVSDARQVELSPPREMVSRGNTNALPVLTTAAAVHALNRQEAERGYPVDIRGVVTCVQQDHQAFTVQDAARGLYAVNLAADCSRLPDIGTYLEIKGTTDPSLFAPVVNATQVIELGAGNLPEPVRPTWDQLLNGSLDAQYVELQGIVTAVSTNGVTLLTREGRISVELRVIGLKPADLARFENSLVRIRGCLFANWDYVTHEVEPGAVRIYGAEISVGESPPEDLFAMPAKSLSGLLLFDPRAGAFQRVKVAGQILHAQNQEFFLTDSTNGLRFVSSKPTALAEGDWVEVVGFPDLSGIAPVLREAVARKTGHGPLPPANVLAKDDLIRSKYDTTWVRVTGKLVSVRDTPAERVLEIQNGLHTFVARLPAGRTLDNAPPVGCLLVLTGVYAGLGGNKAVGQEISSFEILLNGPSGLRVLARPPWWTLERLLFIVAALAGVLAVAILWITQLHRKVEARTAELELQIKVRQRVEQQRLMEQERARVAQDLHDELGSSLTEISMLAARADAPTTADERRKTYLEQIRVKAREIVSALDEIVWAMNPRHDSMASLVSYFSLYADRFLGLAGIAWRLDENGPLSEAAVDSRSRHQLFLAYKEALTNVVRHSGATEVRLQFALQKGQVRLSVADNGRGFPGAPCPDEMDGVVNMRARMQKLGGHFDIRSRSGAGTELIFSAPANQVL